MAQLATGVVRRSPLARKVTSNYTPALTGVAMGTVVRRRAFGQTDYTPPTSGQVWPRGDFV